MNRSGYSEDIYDERAFNLWRGAVASSIRGKRGQAFLREMLEALDAMPEKRLIAQSLIQGGEVCAIGVVGKKRGVNIETLDPEDYDAIARAFAIAAPLVREIECINDDFTREMPEQRWQRVRNWVAASMPARK